MKKILILIFAILSFTAANADVKVQALSKISEKISLVMFTAKNYIK